MTEPVMTWEPAAGMPTSPFLQAPTEPVPVTEPVTEPVTAPAIDVTQLTQEQRAALIKMLAQQNRAEKDESRRARQAAAVTTGGTSDIAAQDAEVLTDIATRLARIPETTTAKSTRPFRRYTGTVTVTSEDGSPVTLHVTCTAHTAKRGGRGH